MQCEVNSVQCAVCSLQCVVYSVQCVVFGVLCEVAKANIRFSFFYFLRISQLLIIVIHSSQKRLLGAFTLNLGSSR